MLDEVPLHYADGPDPHWWARTGEVALDLVLPGDAHGPDRRRLEVAQTVLPHLEAIERRVQWYLDASRRNVGTPDEVDPGGAWESAWVEFGATQHDPLDRFTLYLSQAAGDAERLFHVTFRLRPEQPGTSQPIAFGRRGW